jgi:hypothetical protein
VLVRMESTVARINQTTTIKKIMEGGRNHTFDCTTISYIELVPSEITALTLSLLQTTSIMDCINWLQIRISYCRSEPSGLQPIDFIRAHHGRFLIIFIMM